MMMVDTRDVSRIVLDRVQLVAMLVTISSILWQKLPHFVKSKLSKKTKKVISLNELNTCPLGGIW